MKAIPLRLWALSALSALLQVLPFPIAGPVPPWRRLFCWFCLVPLLWALLDRGEGGKPLRISQTAWLGYLCGFLWYLGNCYWIYPTMHIYGNLASPVAFGIMLLFSMYVGLYHALFGALLGWLHARFGRQAVLWLSPFAWVAVELARARVTGFPWDLLGYTQVDNLTLTRLAPWTGVMGLSLVIAFVNALWLSRLRFRSRPVALGGIAFAGLISVSATVLTLKNLPAAQPVNGQAVLLQENLKVGAEATGPAESRDQMLAAFTQLSLRPQVLAPGSASEKKPDLLIWPEAPAEFFDTDPGFRQGLGSLAAQVHVPVIANSITVAKVDDRGRIEQAYNSASFFLADGTHAGRYDKLHLVPFGEYTPYKQLFFFAGHLLDSIGPFIPGATRESFKVNGHSYGVFICYESIFGDEIREFARNGADVLVNISDDGWYGDSSAPWEHLDMVRMRAIENRRWVLRATNNGVTAAVDPFGRVTTEIPRHIRSSVLAPFGYRTEVTFYTLHGDWIGWLCALITVGALGVSYARPREVH